jgi:hypothetical protein
MMRRLYAAFVDGFGPEAGRELFEEAARGLERALKEEQREERDAGRPWAPDARAPFGPRIRA